MAAEWVKATDVDERIAVLERVILDRVASMLVTCASEVGDTGYALTHVLAGAIVPGSWLQSWQLSACMCGTPCHAPWWCGAVAVLFLGSERRSAAHELLTGRAGAG